MLFLWVIVIFKTLHYYELSCSVCTCYNMVLGKWVFYFDAYTTIYVHDIVLHYILDIESICMAQIAIYVEKKHQFILIVFGVFSYKKASGPKNVSHILPLQQLHSKTRHGI